MSINLSIHFHSHEHLKGALAYDGADVATIKVAGKALIFLHSLEAAENLIAAATAARDALLPNEEPDIVYCEECRETSGEAVLATRQVDNEWLCDHHASKRDEAETEADEYNEQEQV